MPFVDEVVIRVQSGNGGNGCVSFRREKFVPLGGPDGGNGGKGGDVYFRGTLQKSSLLDFQYQPLFKAARGNPGEGKDKNGRGGNDLIIDVPVGTLIYNAQTQEKIADLVTDNKAYRIAIGGRGGRGNRTFVSSTNRAPRLSTPGELGESLELRLELQLLADVGLVGFPNAGKSSLLKTVSRAQPKVADYPFTTLRPHLGVVQHKEKQVVLADIPGLIEGAANGVGLGHQFLRHVKRSQMLLHLVDLSSETHIIKEQVKTIEAELSSYDESLATRPRQLVFTKVDLLSDRAKSKKIKALRDADLLGFVISNHTHEGIESLLDFLIRKHQTHEGCAT